MGRGVALQRLLWSVATLAFAALATVGVASAQQSLPRFDGAAHLGVASCAGPCHARQSALGVASGAAMRGSEIVVWQDQDSARGRHSQAYNVLLEPRGRDIGRKLGIAPERSAECLSCHSDLSASDKRGARFQFSDGVGCEACHGGAEKWLTSHYADGATRAQNIANGMFPTDNIEARARLCVSCHVGSASSDQFVTHRIMGAGHPRLSFEVELFTSLQMHHVEDARYAARKPLQARARVWAIGQAVAARTMVDLFVREERSRSSAFPELSFYDCHSCHRPISDRTDFRSHWRPNPGRPFGPGVPALNDANLTVLVAAAKAFAPAQAANLDAQVKAWAASTLASAEERRRAGEALSATLSQLIRAFNAATITADRSDTALRAVVDATQTERYTSYASAEQAIMAIDSLTRSGADMGGARADRAQRLRGAIDAAYRAVADPNAFDPDTFRQAVADIAARL